jgi:hypothetical protein
VTGPMPSPEELLARMRSVWPVLTWRPVGDVPRTLVVMHSVAVYLPPSWQPLMPAYEERYLSFLLALTSPQTRVVYVTSMPIHPRLIDYWLSLVPGLDTPETRARLTLVPVVDARNVPLTRKVLDHPGAVRRIREAVVDPNLSVTMGHTVTEDDIELSGLLGVPVYGAHPRFSKWGTKTGSREAFEAAGVPVAPGLPGVRGRDDVAEAIERLRDLDPALQRVIVKLDKGVSGIGNGTIRLRGDRATAELCDSIVLEDRGVEVEDYYEHLSREGGVVEAFVTGDDLRSPSVQVRMSPFGRAEVLSTHEQILGGPHGLTYLGCRMPAASEYADRVARMGLLVGDLLAAHGVIGRAAIDFLAVRRGSDWTLYGSEINLRSGGTTHPLATLASLTRGGYDLAAGGFRTGVGVPKCYQATDHLEKSLYAALTTEDLLDLLPQHHLGWDPLTETGVVFHMASAIGGTGTVGLTAIGDTPTGAASLFERARSALDKAVAELGHL